MFIDFWKLPQDDFYKAITGKQVRKKWKKHYASNVFKGFNLNLAETKNCIYILYDYDEDRGYYPIYVGESGATKNRLRAQIGIMQGRVKKIEVLPLKDDIDKKGRLEIENLFISLLQPELNIGNRKNKVFSPLVEIYPKDSHIDSAIISDEPWYDLLKVDDNNEHDVRILEGIYVHGKCNGIGILFSEDGEPYVCEECEATGMIQGEDDII